MLIFCKSRGTLRNMINLKLNSTSRARCSYHFANRAVSPNYTILLDLHFCFLLSRSQYNVDLLQVAGNFTQYDQPQIEFYFPCQMLLPLRQPGCFTQLHNTFRFTRVQNSNTLVLRLTRCC